MNRRAFLRHCSMLWLDVLLVALVLAGLWWCAQDAHKVLPQSWDWSRLAIYLAWHDAEGWHAGLLLKGLWTTVRLGIWSVALALVLGMVLGIFTAHGKGAGVSMAHCLINVLRNTPPLVLLFLIYFFATENLFPGLDQAIASLPSPLRHAVALSFAPPGQEDRMAAAVLTLGLYEGAYVAEIIRAGLLSIPSGQGDAGAALGFSSWQRLRLILLPQALPLMLPPLAGQCISTLKDSALASLISVPELTFQGMEIMSVTRLPFETWVVTGLLYLLICLFCAAIFRRMEKNLRWHKA